MDQFFETIYNYLPAMYMAMLVAVIIKVIAVFYYRGFKAGALVRNFFRLYKKHERLKAVDNKKRLFFMQLTNTINIFLYVCIAIFLLMLAIYQGSIFSKN